MLVTRIPSDPSSRFNTALLAPLASRAHGGDRCLTVIDELRHKLAGSDPNHPAMAGPS